MDLQQDAEADVTVRAQNVGGIDETAVTFQPGVTVLAGRNATNRTSLLQAIMAGVGGDQVSLKGDADEGSVELVVGDETYTRTLTWRNGEVVLDGDPYTDDATLAELYAFLLESNESRRAVARGDDLRELIMRPVDTAAIQEDIERLQAERQAVDDELDELDDLADRLQELEAERVDAEERRESLREDLESAREAVDDADAELEQRKEDKAELEDALADLRDAQSDLEDARFQLRTERETVEQLREEREELEADLEDLTRDGETSLQQLEARIDDLRERKRGLDAKVNQVQGLVQFNEGALEGETIDLLDVLRERDEDEAPTSQLLPDDGGLVCWTCGQETSRDDVEAMLDRLREHSRSLMGDREAVTSELDELTSERSAVRDRERERQRVESRLAAVENEIEESEAAIEEHEAAIEEHEAAVEELEATVSALQAAENEELLERHSEVNQLEFDLEQVESRIESVEAEIDDAEARLGERENLEARREEIDDELAERRTRIEALERDAVEAFNDHIEEVLAILEYGNVERIWIERTTRQVREGRRSVERSSFDLHVVRSTESGAAYEDTVDHLSESEREVTGLVFALAGYLVHEVYDRIPFMLLDSLEAIDAERIARLVDYFREYAPYLVVALLPEDAQALDDYHQVTDI